MRPTGKRSLRAAESALVAAENQGADLQGEEIAELLNQVKQRVRARYPSASVPVDSGGADTVHIPLANLLPLVHARDAAQAKVAAIGSVNPRAGGLLNRTIQAFKKTIARSLSWFVRDQITFNRQLMACIEAQLEALSEVNLAMSTLAGQFNERAKVIGELKDIRSHWHEWRQQWERNLAANEMQFLRSVADLQTGFSHRTTVMETNFRDVLKTQHGDYLTALDRVTLDTQKRLWADLEKVRLEYERVIHNELRVVRQKALALAPARDTATSIASEHFTLGFDYTRFADRFRGSEEYVRENQLFYVPLFREAGRVLDIGCGRGEFLELLRDQNIPARGIEMSDESVGYCRSKGLEVEKADLFSYLAGLPEASEDVIFCSQVVEHLEPARLPELVQLCASRLRKGGVLAMETPNPECLAIFATHFYLDPTHTRPVPHPLLAFYLEESGMGGVEVHRFAPAVESFPEIRSLPADFADKFFGGLDYAIIARKL